MRLSARGSWPGQIVLRQGWAKAQARPWNADITDAHLRLERGGASFLSDCAAYLTSQGASAVASPPLPESSSGIWLSAGYLPYIHLDLYSRDLQGPIPEPMHEVRTGADHDWREVVAIDRAAFRAVWRLDRAGLHDAMTATPHSALLVTSEGRILTGFAIVGVGSIAGYLQRVAVRPDRQNAGFGHSLVRAAMKWAQRRRGRSLLLNTQPDNAAAAHLYDAEGFSKLLDQLTVLRIAGPAAGQR